MRNEAAPVSTGTAALCWHWNPGRTSRSPPPSPPRNPGGLFAPAHRRPRPRLRLRHDHRGSRLRPIRDKVLRITSTYARSARHIDEAEDFQPHRTKLPPTAHVCRACQFFETPQAEHHEPFITDTYRHLFFTYESKSVRQPRLH